MDSEFQELEGTLKGMRPAAPDAACLDRLLAAVEGRLQVQDLSAAGIEGKLSGLRPAALAPDLSARMLAAVERVPFPAGGKVVLFPGARKAPAKSSARRRPWYAAAAAVAVAGAFSALMVGGPGNVEPAGKLAGGQAPAPRQLPRSAGNAANFVPAAMGSGLQDVTDLGVRWTREGKPVRVYRVIYRDKVELKNEHGEIIQVEQPREEIFVMPEKID